MWFIKELKLLFESQFEKGLRGIYAEEGATKKERDR